MAACSSLWPRRTTTVPPYTWLRVNTLEQVQSTTFKSRLAMTCSSTQIRDYTPSQLKLIPTVPIPSVHHHHHTEYMSWHLESTKTSRSKRTSLLTSSIITWLIRASRFSRWNSMVKSWSTPTSQPIVFSRSSKNRHRSTSIPSLGMINTIFLKCCQQTRASAPNATTWLLLSHSRRQRLHSSSPTDWLMFLCRLGNKWRTVLRLVSPLITNCLNRKVNLFSTSQCSLGSWKSPSLETTRMKLRHSSQAKNHIISSLNTSARETHICSRSSGSMSRPKLHLFTSYQLREKEQVSETRGWRRVFLHSCSCLLKSHLASWAASKRRIKSSWFQPTRRRKISCKTLTSVPSSAKRLWPISVRMLLKTLWWSALILVPTPSTKVLTSHCVSSHLFQSNWT